eukprot:5584564-Prymnesium_polylepis.1
MSNTVASTIVDTGSGKAVPIYEDLSDVAFVGTVTSVTHEGFDRYAVACTPKTSSDRGRGAAQFDSNEFFVIGGATPQWANICQSALSCYRMNPATSFVSADTTGPSALFDRFDRTGSRATSMAISGSLSRNEIASEKA